MRSGFEKRKKAKTVREKVLAESDGEAASHERALCMSNKKGRDLRRVPVISTQR